ncbi:hypothetical protein [Chryseobacterium kimseyorum]|uniref:hypothetical protein n=1 Tax=Chryseobacterium kimseyorum TaxID=2984028 RepID=UPI002228106A|nr:hypothetical protein [Chryseobacterium kimseyorum]
MNDAYGAPSVNSPSLKGWYNDKIRCRINNWSNNYFTIEYEDVSLYDLYIKRRIQEEKENAKKEF